MFQRRDADDVAVDVVVEGDDSRQECLFGNTPSGVS